MPLTPPPPRFLQELIERAEQWQRQMQVAVANRSALKKASSRVWACRQPGRRRWAVRWQAWQAWHAGPRPRPHRPQMLPSLPRQMREVLNAGLRLPVELPDIDILRAEIRKCVLHVMCMLWCAAACCAARAHRRARPPCRAPPPRRREWEDATRRALGSRQNVLASLIDLLSTASNVGLDETALAQALREKVEVAEAWEARAADLLERRGGAPPRRLLAQACFPAALHARVHACVGVAVPSSRALTTPDPLCAKIAPADGSPESSRPTLEAVHQLVTEGFSLGAFRRHLSAWQCRVGRAGSTSLPGTPVWSHPALQGP